MKYLCAILLALLITTHLAHAQALAPDLSLEISPGNPAPGAVTTITARSYGSDLNQLSVSWTYNGTAVAQGLGKTSIRVAAPAAGTTGVIVATTSEGASATAVLRPASIDLLWEAADAYTPPFYKGKALLPIGGMLRVTAIPAASTSKSLSYTWQRNGSAVDAQSGFGRTSITLKNDPLNASERINVTAGTGSYAATNTLNLNVYAPLALAYENKDGYIDYAHGYTSTIPFNKSGALLHFEPYYFSVPRSVESDLTTSLSVNKEQISSSNEIAISRPETGTQSTLTFDATTRVYSLQHLSKTFTLLFN